jgi:hypothetical protein
VRLQSPARAGFAGAVTALPRSPGRLVALATVAALLLATAFVSAVTLLVLGVSGAPAAADAARVPTVRAHAADGEQRRAPTVSRSARAAAAGPGRTGAQAADLPAPALPVFALAGRLELTELSPSVHTVGYHQARGSGALALTPVAPAGDEALILPSRGRGTAATSAVDVALPDERVLHAPVSGTVTSVEKYRLYNRASDVRVAIRPDDAPDHEVVLLHVARVRVSAGDRVVAGETVIAGSARVLPFPSQIERWSGAMPHVHLEVRGP